MRIAPRPEPSAPGLRVPGLEMPEIVKLDTDIPTVRALVQFRNHDQPCLIIRQDKARSDAKAFREAASMIPSTDRGKLVSEWLLDLAGKYEQMENPQIEATA